MKSISETNSDVAFVEKIYCSSHKTCFRQCFLLYVCTSVYVMHRISVTSSD